MDTAMRSILVHADNGAATAQRLELGIDLTRRATGHLTVLVNTPFQRFVAMDPFGGAYLATQAISEAQGAEDALVARLSERLGREDISWTVERSPLELVDALAGAGRLADIAIVSYGAALDNQMVGAAAIALDAPLLALPAGNEAPALDGRAMVAWDGGYQSANALRAAVPLLAAASGVDVVTVTEKTEGFPATEALRYLSTHGIHAELVERERGLSTVEEVLEQTAVDRGAQWLVMGAYGHSRLRETIFGGVTRYFLDGARLPLLLKH